MPAGAKTTIDVYVEEDGTLETMRREIRHGLTSSPRSLPSKYFYDERGSELFERITTLPEYYLTRAERDLLDAESERIARLIRPCELVELGAGSATKTRLLIEAALADGDLRRYVPVEVSREIAEATAHDVAARYPGLEVHAIVGDFENHLDEVPTGERRLVAFLGSTIGNYRRDEAVAFLATVRQLLHADDALLLGTDLVKEPSRLEAAYNDSEGVTAEFNRNILRVVNRRLDGDLDPDGFEHVSRYDDAEQRIETFLRSTRAQTARIGALDLVVEFEPGELLHTEVSCKYTEASVADLVAGAGLRLEHWIPDDAGDFALSLSRPR